MSTPNNNISNLTIEEQIILKEELENTVKEISSFFKQEKIEQIALETKFVERESKLTGLLFLSIFVFGASKYGNPTLEELIGLVDTYVKDVTLSRSGLHQRINEKAVTFFEKILNLAVDHSIPDVLKSKLPSQFGGIQIWDSTSFQLPPGLATFFVGKGGSGSPAGAKIQFGYDLNRHSWKYVLQSATEADNSMATQIVDFIQPGDLLLQDLGYFNVETFEAIRLKGAYYLSRLKHDVNIYQKDIMGTFFYQDLPSLLEHYWFEERLELPVFLRSKNNVLTSTRMIIEKLPAQAVNQRLRKSHKEAQSRGRTVSAETIFLSSFNFYVTNAPNDLLPASCCRFLYTIRWQIELVFKAWKSHLEIHKIHVKHRPERFKTTIFAKLIFVTITAKIIGISTVFLWLTSQLEISHYRALRHFQNIAEPWFIFVICSDYNAISGLLNRAISFIQKRSFKIPQWDRIYPLEMLQIFEDFVMDT